MMHMNIWIKDTPAMWEIKVFTMAFLQTAEAEFVADVHAGESDLLLIMAWPAHMTS